MREMSSDGEDCMAYAACRCRFDALGLVHKLDIDGATGTVTYLSRKLTRGTEAYIGEHGAMPANGGTFAEPPATGLVGRALAGMTGDKDAQSVQCCMASCACT